MAFVRHLAGGLLCCLFSHAAWADDAPAAITVGPDMTVAGTVAGAPARFQLLPNGSSTLVLNPDAAARYGLRGGWIAVKVKVGPVAIAGQTAVTRYGVAGRERRRRVGWFERPIAPGFDGMLGPAALAFGVVRFQLRPEQAGERIWMLPLVEKGYGGVGTEVKIGNQLVFVEWALAKRHNGATAAAGAVLASAYEGQFVGRAFSDALAFGVVRPVRQMVLARPFALGPLRLGTIITRTTDYGDTSHIPDADAHADPGEITVTARGKASRALYHLEIGSEALAGCSSLTFDKPRRQILLSCR